MTSISATGTFTSRSTPRCTTGFYPRIFQNRRVAPPQVKRRYGGKYVHVYMKAQAAVIEKEEGDREGGTGVIDRPDFDQGNLNLGPLTESNFGATDIGSGKELGGGDYRLLLLDSETHSEQLVVSVITEVIPNTDDLHAKNCFATSKQLGQALVTSALKEHAELYCEQMLRKGCKASIEPDTTTM